MFILMASQQHLSIIPNWTTVGDPPQCLIRASWTDLNIAACFERPSSQLGAPPPIALFSHSRLNGRGLRPPLWCIGGGLRPLPLPELGRVVVGTGIAVVRLRVGVVLGWLNVCALLSSMK